jgi:poly-gamma-glutamate synthesis protein (capsule biosynthesis protein)
MAPRARKPKRARAKSNGVSRQSSGALAWVLVAVLAGACDGARAPDAGATASVSAPATAEAAATVPATPAAATSAAPAPAGRTTLTLIAAGDTYFGRTVGQMLLRDPSLDLFGDVRELLASGDVRFGNLECQLSDQKGETGKPDRKLVFTGPPSGADALRRAGFDIVSLANNHMWDYGKGAFFETLANLERVGVGYVGAGRTRAQAYAATVIERDGFRLAFVAATDVWNQGPIDDYEARDFVAKADPELVAAEVRRLRADPSIDAIAVSYHGGSEYMEEPEQRARRFARAVVDAGADVLLGHHPHSVQGIGFYRGKPLLYSLGNFTMGMHPDHAWSQMGMLARLRFERGAPAPTLEVCPYHLLGNRPVAIARDGRRAFFEQWFFRKLSSMSLRVAGIDLGAVAPDGCAPVRPPSTPYPGAVP